MIWVITLAVADLVEMFDLAETTRKLFRMKRKEHTLLLGAMLSAAQFAARGRVAYGCVTREMLARAGAQNADIEGLIDSLGSLSDAIDCLEKMIDKEKKRKSTTKKKKTE